MAITLPVKAVEDRRSFEKVADRSERKFAQAGADAGKAFAKGLDQAASKADPKSADRWTKAYDKVADAAGKVRVEEAKLADLRRSNASNTRIISQAEALERARRAEARATRDAAGAYKDYQRSAAEASQSAMQRASGQAIQTGRDTAENFVSGFAGASALTRLASATGPIGLALAGVVGLGALTGRKLVEQIELGMASLSVKDQFAARLGIDGATVERFGAAAGKAYADSWGQSVEENLRIAQVAVQGGLINTDATDAEIQKVIEQIHTVSTVLGEDAQQIARGVRNFVRTGVVDSTEEALDLIVAASQRGLNISGDLLDTFEEYGTKFRDVGLTGADALGLIAQMWDAGIRNTDVAADALKEFAIRAVDGSKTTKQAFNALGFSADDMARRFAAGGDTAREAFGEVLSALNSVSDPLDQETIAVGLFGTKWEDAGDAIKNADLSTAASELGDIAGATQTATDKLEEHRSSWGQLGRDIDQTFTKMREWLADTAIGKFLGRDIPEFLSDLLTGIPTGPTGPIPGAIPGTPYRGPGDIIGGGAPATNPFNPSGALDGITPPGIFGDIIGNIGGSYGLPRGTAINYGASGFPPWVYQLADAFGMEASTYAGHQEGSGQNRGIDWRPKGVSWDSPEGAARMQRFAEYLRATGMMEQVIYENAVTGAKIGAADGKPVGPGTSQPGYFRNDWAGHRDHIHTRQSMPIPVPGATATFSSNRVPMSPHGGGIGSPGYDDRGRYGVFIPDERAIRNARERVADIEEEIAESKAAELEAQQSILDAQVRRAEIYNNVMSLDEDKAAADKAVADATKARDNLRKRTQKLQERSLRDANESLADAQRGRFSAAPSSSAGSGMAGGMSVPSMTGAPIASDFGISGGLPGMAANLTTMLANLGFAPMVGALTGVKSVFDPFGTAGSGLMGIAGALGGFGGGGAAFGTPGSTVSGVAPGMGNLFGGPLGPAPGPTPSTVSGVAPAGGRGEGGLGIAGGILGAAMGALSSAAGAGGMAANAMAPGAGMAAAAAADIGIKLVNRTAQYLGQNAGIAVGGLMEGLLPVDSELADPMNSWFGRIVGGMMGATPALPNMAGGQAAQPEGQQPAGQGQGGAPGTQVDVTYNNYQATEDRAGADLTNHLMAMNLGPGQFV